jgi:hypothetical protein
VKLFGTVYIAAEYNLFGPLRIQPSRKEAECSHSREQIKENFRKTEPRAFFGDNHVAGKSCFEAASQSVPLNQAYCRDGGGKG